jgi:hypothetical protein
MVDFAEKDRFLQILEGRCCATPGTSPVTSLDKLIDRT